MRGLVYVWLLITSCPTLGQGDIYTKFTITDKQGFKIKGCTVRLYDHNTLQKEVMVNRSTIKFDMRCESYYTIEVMCDGYITERLAFNTRLDGRPVKVKSVKFYVELIDDKAYEQLEETEDVLDYPVTIIEYDQEKQQFGHNFDYTRSTELAINRLDRKAEKLKRKTKKK